MRISDWSSDVCSSDLTRQHLRIWCAGCSTGQEALSLAMLVRKHASRWPGLRVQILATDISSSVIARAKSGLYNQMEVQRGLGVTDLLGWFEQTGRASCRERVCQYV